MHLKNNNPTNSTRGAFLLLLTLMAMLLVVIYMSMTSVANFAQGEATPKRGPSPTASATPLPSPTPGASTVPPNCAMQTDIPQIECEALVAISAMADGSPFWNYDHYFLDFPCSWIGVNCSNGTVIDVSLINVPLIGLPPEISNLSNLTSLRLTCVGLSSLPPEIGELSNLTRLEVSCNELTSLPSELSNLSNLAFLDLRHNNLTSLPPMFGNLVNLRGLYLAYNNITTLPNDIGSLDNLSWLDLSNNALGTSSSEILKLSDMQIQFLELSHNGFTSLPEEIGNLSDVSFFYLVGNDLTTLPAQIIQLPNVNVSYNLLTSLPPEIVNMTGFIDITYNCLDAATMPEAIVEYLNENMSNWAETQYDCGATPTPSPTPTVPSPTPSNTWTPGGPTATFTPSHTWTPSPTVTATLTATVSPTPSYTWVPSSSPTVFPTVTPSATWTVHPSVTASNTSVPTSTDIATETSISEPTAETPQATAILLDDIVDAPDKLDVNPMQGRPVITWADDPDSQWFNIWMFGPVGGVPMRNVWVAKPDAPLVNDAIPTVACDGTVCTFAPDINPRSDTYEVWMRSWGTPDGNPANGSFSTGGNAVANGVVYDQFNTAIFTLPAGVADAATNINGTVNGNGQATITWTGANWVTWYEIWVGTEPDEDSDTYDTLEYQSWALASTYGCENAGTCTYTPNATVTSGTTYAVWMRTFGPGGVRDWQRVGDFTAP